MSRNSLILCLSVLACMLVGIGVAVAFLYSGSDDAAETTVDEGRYLLLPAVPSDAVAVMCYSEADDVENHLFSKELFRAAKSSRAVVSVHHSGAGVLKPFYVFDAGRSSSDTSSVASALLETAAAQGLHAELLQGSRYPSAGKHFASRSIVIASELENLVKSSVRHLQEGVSVMDASGFAEASHAVSSNDVIFISNDHIRRLAGAVLTKSYSRYAPFFQRFADWTIFSLGNKELKGAAVYEDGSADFMSVLQALEPATSSLSSVLPSYTIFASSLQVRDEDAYLSAYKGFVDSKQELAKYSARQRELASSAGRSPEELFKVAAPVEIAKAAFKVSGEMVCVNLMKLGKDASLSAFGEEIASRDYKPSVHTYPYPGFLASVYGGLFQLKDESCFTYIDGWIISGSRTAIDEYVVDAALEYTLADQMKDAGMDDLLARVPSVFQAYFSFSEDKDSLGEIFTKDALSVIGPYLDGIDYCPFVFRVTKDKKNTVLRAQFSRTEVKRTKAPEKERDTTVVIPQGPYAVKNSGTGKMNEFYQNSHLSLCLKQDGKDLWGIPFKEKICGYAETIDYFANGKLQILFGAGSKLYLIDRLGRFVGGFPVDLGKPILLGPKPYDFNGVHKYNALVLHKDNTIEMYSLKGQKPEAWKGITADETIKALPEKVEVAGKSYWVVRTSIQTLIFPFYGGAPVSTFEGDKKIRPDSPVTVVDGTSLEVECYDGQKRTVKIK